MKRHNYILIALVLSIILLFFDKGITRVVIGLRFHLLDEFMVWVSSPLTTILLFLIVTVFLLREKKKRQWVLPLWIIISITWVVTGIVKIIIGRTRPFEALALPLVNGANYLFSSWNSSFPSMHAAGAFALVPIINKLFPKVRWFWISIAAIISFSRLYLGVHYLSDILIGATIGILISESIIEIKEKWSKK